MMRRQRGVTMIGWICLLTPVAVCLYGAIRVTPEYLNYYKVLQAMKETASEFKGDDTLTAPGIRAALEKRFDTGYVDHPNVKEILITKGSEGWTMTMDYEATAPMFGNLYMLMAFKNSVDID